MAIPSQARKHFREGVETRRAAPKPRVGNGEGIVQTTNPHWRGDESRSGMKIRRPQGREGSIPSARTTLAPRREHGRLVRPSPLQNRNSRRSAFKPPASRRFVGPGGSDSDNGLAVPASVDEAPTANYGSSTNCNGGGEPSEVVAWAAQALIDGITVSHISVGNEVYGS